MGRRKNRKRERRTEQRTTWAEPAGGALFLPQQNDYDDLLLAFEGMSGRSTAQAVHLCGNCKEFLEDEHGGRGECLHPGSGILSPWTDTPGCSFFARRR